MNAKTPFLTLFFLCTLVISLNAQETAKPLTDTEVVRKVSFIDVDGKFFFNVVVTMICNSPDLFSDKYRVKVKISEESGKTVWKKTFKNVFLFVYSNGQVQVGKNNFNQLIISRYETSNDFWGEIREKEGIY